MVFAIDEKGALIENFPESWVAARQFGDQPGEIGCSFDHGFGATEGLGRAGKQPDRDLVQRTCCSFANWVNSA